MQILLLLLFIINFKINKTKEVKQGIKWLFCLNFRDESAFDYS